MMDVLLTDFEKAVSDTADRARTKRTRTSHWLLPRLAHAPPPIAAPTAAPAKPAALGIAARRGDDREGARRLAIASEAGAKAWVWLMAAMHVATHMASDILWYGAPVAPQ